MKFKSLICGLVAIAISFLFICATHQERFPMLLATKHDALLKESLFASPQYLSFRLNPAKNQACYVGADSRGVNNLFVSSVDNFKDFEQLSFYQDPEIIQFFWAPKGDKILLVKDNNGDGRLRLHLYDVTSKKMTDISQDFEKASSLVVRMHQDKNQVLVGFNQRNPHFHDLYTVDLDSFEKTLVFENDQYVQFLASEKLDVLLKVEVLPNGTWKVLDKQNNTWLELSYDESFHSALLGYDDKTKEVFLLDNRAFDTNELIAKNLISKKERRLAYSKKSDVSDVFFLENKPVAWAEYYLDKKWHVLDELVKKDFHHLSTLFHDQFYIISANPHYFIVETRLPHEGGRFYLFNRKSQDLQELGESQGANYHSMYAMEYQAHDGKTITAYYTLPKEHDKNGKLDKPLPLVVFPHGGPFKFRDYWEFNPYHQWIASQGYIALSMNFRLSSGFGKELVNSGEKQYGKNAHQDVLDAVSAMLDNGLTTKDSLAILGGSYGGYETLAALSFTPDVFKCGVAICPPSDLASTLRKVPNYWEWTVRPLSDTKSFFTRLAFIKSMGGDPNTKEGAAFLESCSPLYYTKQIKAPLLIVHGQNDHVVAEAEARQIFDKLKADGKKVKYLRFPDEGHRFAKFSNKMQYLDLAEQFLSEHLNGSYKPVNSQILKDASGSIFDSQIL